MNYRFARSALEQEQQNFLNLVENIAQDVTPLGKMQSEQNNDDSEDEAASDGKRHCNILQAPLTSHFRSREFSKRGSRQRGFRWPGIVYSQLLIRLSHL